MNNKKYTGITQLLDNTSDTNKSSDFIPNAMLSSDNQQLQNRQQQLYEEQINKGYEQGYKQANDEVHKIWSEKMSLLDKICDEINYPLAAIDKQIQAKTADLAIAIAKQIIRRELTLDSGQVVSAVKQAISLIPSDNEMLSIYINPSDFSIVKEIFAQGTESSRINIIQDPTIDRGGCKATTQYSLVDLTINKQIANIATQVFGDQRNDHS